MISLNAWGQTPAVAKQVRQALRLERHERAAQRAALRAARTVARHMNERGARRMRMPGREGADPLFAAA